ncbi:TRAP transporter large permease [Sulfobacillus acidophilus]|uniref:TRAP transporter large permease n=1 Tax=Sulfobacillus acidophilus TaxID=53633 RepID=A0ABS3AWJ1_9FIRM|nr:TRAP transporter large permease [Sulfobacillus acidophilus]
MIATAAFGANLLLGFGAFRKKPAIFIFLALLSTALFFVMPSSYFLIYSAMLLSLTLGLPLFVLIGLIVLICFMSIAQGYESIDSMTFLVRKVQEIGNKEVLLAIPFFIIAGEIMTEGSLAKQLISVAKVGFGWLPGGLAVAGVFGCIFFAAISGSSPVTVIAIGSIMVPALVKANYKENFSIGLLTTAGSLGILIPPSIPMIIYALMVGSISPIDPTDLFLAGIGPGLLIGSLLSAYAIYVGIRDKHPVEKFSAKKLLKACYQSIWSLLLPVIILGGIYSGAFTPTEGAAVCVVYALVVEMFIHRSLSPANLIVIAERSMVMMGTLFLIMALALGLNHFFVLEQIPDMIVEGIKGLNLSRFEFLLCINLFLLMVGAIMDIISAILILAPMLAPMAVAMGIDPLHMGIIFIVNLEIGYLTPPVGLNLFVASTLFKKGLGDIIKATLPTLAIMFLGLGLITWIPNISLAPVHFVMKNKISKQNNISEKRVKTLQELMRQSKH